MTKLNIVQKLLLILIMGFLVSCGGLNSQESLQKAREYYKKQDYRAAIITVKSLLSKDPHSVDARLLLSEIYLAIGDGKSAEKELRQYIKNGGNEKGVRAQFGLALLYQYDYKRLLKEIQPESLDVAGRAAVLAMRGDAYLGLNQLSDAIRSYDESLSLDGTNQRAMLGKVIYLLGVKEREKALFELKHVLATHPDFAKAYYIKGQMEESKGANDGALSAYEKSVKLYGKHIYGDDPYITRIAYINLLMRMGKPAEAKLNLNEVAKVQPLHPLTQYTQAIFYFQEKRLDQAEQKLYQVLKSAPDDLPTHLLLGAILYQKGLFEQANNYVSRYVANIPSNIQARKLLAAIRIKLQRQDEAIEVLKQASPDQRDSEIVAMIGQLAIEAGKPQLALTTLRSEAAKRPGDLKIREVLARSLMDQGEYHEAIRTIQEYSGPEKDKASLLLLEALLKKGEQDQAQKLVNELLDKNPDSSVNLVAAGYVALDLGKRNVARNYFEKALGKSHDFVPAMLYLARMDLEDGKLEDAQKYYDQVLLLRQTNSQALMGLAQIEERRGNTEFALKWLEKAHGSNKGELLPALILADYHLRNADPQKALSLLTDLANHHPDNVNVLLLLARAYTTVGNNDNAEKTYLSIIGKHPNVTAAYIDLGALYTRTKQPGKAKEILSRAVVTDPNSLQARGMMGIAEMQGGNFDLALKIARQIQKDNNASAVGYVLAGDIYLYTKKYDEAISSYQEASKRTNANQIAYKLFHVYQKKGNTKAGIQALENWVRNHPSDLKVELDLANAYVWTNQPAKAENMFKSILQKNPNHIGSLNNLAELYLAASPKSALSYAEKAHKLSPGNPAIMDTLGWAYYRNGNLQKALDLVSRAASGMDHPTVHYHHAVLLAKSGNPDKAIQVLKPLLDSQKPFAEIKDARELLKTLQK